MKVVEIFNSIEGEGKRAGLPATFIRLHGCNLRCNYCDSMYAVQGEDYTEMTIPEIIEKVEKIGCPNITLTGGEPLIHKGVIDLLAKLSEKRYWINVETNGSVPIHYRTMADQIFYTVDYKTACSGMEHLMNKETFRSMTTQDVLKFVVGTEEDLQKALEIGRKYPWPYIYLSPVFGSIEPKRLVEFILENELWDWKVQLQMHKLIWSPDMKGV